MLTLITNGKILTSQGWIEKGWLLMENSQIVSIGQGATDVVADKKIDAKGNYILPGGIDIHVHGGGGHDFMEGSEEAFRVATQTHLRHGTTAIFPTLAASSTEMIMAAAATDRKSVV